MQSYRSFLAACLVTIGLGALVFWPSEPTCAADKPAPTKPDAAKSTNVDLNNVGLEIQALETIRDLQLNPEQLRTIERVAARTATELTQRKPAKVSAALGKHLIEYRDALAKGAEDTSDVQGKIEKLKSAESPGFELNFDTTERAKRQAPGVMRSLRVTQVAAYAGAHSEEFIDPIERIEEGLAKCRTAKDEEWHQVRALIAEEVARSVAGFDADKSSEVVERVAGLLDKARRLKTDEFKKQSEALHREGHDTLGGVGPTTILRHQMEDAIADLLSNPQLAAAVKVRLQNAKR